MLRRSYSYNDGVNFTTERWPPWRQGMEYDAGMFFVCFQRDPRTGFIAVFRELANHDSKLNQFWTHVGGGLFAVPPGCETRRVYRTGFVRGALIHQYQSIGLWGVASRARATER